MMTALAESNSSACMVTGASGGAGAMPVAPVPVPSGGWGNATFTFCRSNQPGSKIEVNDSIINIEHGLDLADEIKEKISTLETAVKYLLQRLVDTQPKPGGAF